MIIPVKCFTCGNVIGNKYLYYVNKVIELKRDKNLDHENIQYLTNEEMDKFGKTKTLEKSVEGQVLDELKLTKQCCRRHMLTHVDVFS
jgi:DNA-directed RNA polymerase subunit N (RpoN/RPB10)|tara:strand:- start:13 stop:276 length:264 start_codon:yes stop_codon:yes gene_type:complete